MKSKKNVQSREKAVLKTAAKDLTKVLGVPVVAADDRKAKVEAWRKEVAEKAARPDPALDKAVEDAKNARAAKAAKAAKAKQPKKPGCLDAAVKVLAEAKKPLQADEMVKRMLAKGLWKTKGKTPEATLYAAIIREIGAKGKAARFRRAKMSETKDGKAVSLRGYFDLTDAGKKE